MKLQHGLLIFPDLFLTLIVSGPHPSSLVHFGLDRKWEERNKIPWTTELCYVNAYQGSEVGIIKSRESKSKLKH